MKREEKVNYYYDKLLEMRNSFGCYKKVKSLSCNNISIKEILDKIINSNLDYLLTDGFLYYLLAKSIGSNADGFRIRLYNNLNSLLDSNQLLDNVADYIGTIDFGLSKHHFMPYTNGFSMIILKKNLNEVESNLYKEFEHYKIRLECDNKIYGNEYLLLKYVMQVLGGYCLISNSPNEYNMYALPYLENPRLKLEELKIQGMYQEIEELTESGLDCLIDYDALNNYVINNLYNKKNKIMIK